MNPETTHPALHPKWMGRASFFSSVVPKCSIRRRMGFAWKSTSPARARPSPPWRLGRIVAMAWDGAPVESTQHPKRVRSFESSLVLLTMHVVYVGAGPEG